MIDAGVLTFGSDPEFFAIYFDDEDKKECVYPPVAFEKTFGLTPLRIIEGQNIDHPVYKIIPKDSGKIELMADGAAFEITVPPVKFNQPDKLFDSIQEGFKVGEQMFWEYGFWASVKPTVFFDTVAFGPDKKGKEFWSACIFGCDPDFSAYDDQFKSSTFEVKDYTFRHAGGHLHVGINDKDLLEMVKNYPKQVIQIMDLLVGSFALINSPFKEEEKMRMTYYGEAGKYRPTDYGFEYRSPSVSWTTKKELYPEIFKLTVQALSLFDNPTLGKKALENSVNFLTAYNEQDYTELENIIKEIQKLL